MRNTRFLVATFLAVAVLCGAGGDGNSPEKKDAKQQDKTTQSRKDGKTDTKCAAQADKKPTDKKPTEKTTPKQLGPNDYGMLKAKIGAGELPNLVSLACDDQDRVFALTASGNSGGVKIYSKEGKPAGGFSCKLKGVPGAIAVAPDGAVYVVSIKTDTVKLTEAEREKMAEEYTVMVMKDLPKEQRANVVKEAERLEAEKNKKNGVKKADAKKDKEVDKVKADDKADKDKKEKKEKKVAEIDEKTVAAAIKKILLSRMPSQTQKQTAFLAVFDEKGKLTSEDLLPKFGDVTATAFSQGKLLLADRSRRALAVYDPATKKQVGSIGKDFRLCCGIFGFAVDKSGNVLVGNLGAFHVDRFSPDGKLQSSFGRRGDKDDEFHGCCNPSNLVVLPDGRILTAEKSPLRLKIYSADGKKCEQIIEDLSSLGGECSYLPMAVDSAGNVYMACVATKCIVKCVKGAALLNATDTTSLAPPQGAAPAAAKPISLTIGVNEIFCKKTACKCVHHVATRTYDSLQKRLKDKYDIDLKLNYYPEDTFTLHKDIAAGKLDGALAKPWSILKHARESGRDFRRVVDLQGPRGMATVCGVVVVKRDSAIHDWPDLKGKRIALGDADGYEKHHAALALLKSHGIEPKPADLTEFSGCTECIGAILDGKADAAIISDYAFDADCLVDIAKKEDFHVLGVTKTAIPQTSLLLDVGRVSPDVAQRLRQALVELAGDADLKESLLGDGFTAPAPWSPDELPPVVAKKTAKETSEQK